MHSLSKEQLIALLQAARKASMRDWLMIVVAFWHGLRASEVIAIKRDDIQDMQLTVQRLKGSMKTTQPLVNHQEPLLNEAAGFVEFMQGMPGNQTLFPISRQHFWRIVRKHGATAKIPARLCHPHTMKHSIAAQSIQKAGIENVRQRLGHQSIGSTGAYLKVSDEDAARAVEGALEL
jgi:type 1 fimbriae regulatory protein FimB